MTLDREKATAFITNCLRHFEERNLRLDEIWDVRQEQLNRNRLINKHFGQFEKATREVRIGYLDTLFAL